MKEMFKDERNRLYLTFIYPPLRELRIITKSFQKNSANNIKIFEELETYFLSLAKQIIKPAVLRNKSVQQLCDLNVDTDFCMLSLMDADLGDNFVRKLERASLSLADKERIMSSAFGFLKALFQSLQDRLSGNAALINAGKPFLLPGFLGTGRIKFATPFFPQDDTTLGRLESQVWTIECL